MRRVAVLIAVGALVAGLMAAPAAAVDIEGDQFYTTSTTIAADETVKGNVTITGGSLNVLGTVEGNITGTSGVVVNGSEGGGVVKGDITAIEVLIDFGATVEGNIKAERLLVVLSDSLVKGNVSVSDARDLVTIAGSTVEGNVEIAGTFPRLRNSHGIEGSLVKGNVSESTVAGLIIF